MTHVQVVSAGGRTSFLSPQPVSTRVTVTGGVRELGGGAAGTLSRTSAQTGQVFGSVAERKQVEAFRAGEVESGVTRAQKLGMTASPGQPAPGMTGIIQGAPQPVVAAVSQDRPSSPFGEAIVPPAANGDGLMALLKSPIVIVGIVVVLFFVMRK